MKKLLFVLAFASASVCAMAQDAYPVQKYSVATNSFGSNWFVQIGGAWNVWYSSQEHGAGLSKSPFKSFRAGPSAAIAVGKWFTPGVGLRTKLQGIWGKQVNWTEDASGSNKYWVLNEQVLFNLNNLIGGYNPERVWSIIPFAGAGVGRSMTYNAYATGLSLGLLNQFRLSDKVALNVEMGWNMYEQDLDGVTGNTQTNRIWDARDNNVYAEVGFTINLGKGKWNKTPDVDAIQALSQSQIDALNAQLNDANAENGRLKRMLAEKKNAPAPAATVKELASTPVSVFFKLNKAKIACKKELVNVEALAKYAKEHHSRLLVDGYADSATGKPDYNLQLSEKRAAAVADELVKMGVSRDNIVTKGNGGVDELSPNSFNRRVIITIIE